MHHRPWIPAVGLTVLVALPLSCSSSHSTMEIRARASTTEAEGIAGIRLRLGAVEYSSEDFTTDSDGVPEIFTRVPSSGDLQVAVRLTQAGVVVAEGSFTLEMRDDFEWGVDVFRQASDPRVGCFGCAGAWSVAILEAAQNEPGEAIWLTWGGRRRGSDIVF